MYIIPTMLLAVIGIGLIVSASLLEEDKYKVLKQEALLLDEEYVQELNARYEQLKNKYTILIIAGFGFLLAGILPFGLAKKEVLSSDFLAPYYPVCIGLIAVGIFMLAQMLTTLEAYKLLAKNDAYVNQFRFKLLTKARRKFDSL
ncbi:hypothetical protein [Paenibacillus aquistagni]|uniref:hypothetical protein n=1 Tax=Paenibacillus aquistagni TaxID=1852522 RepID=UPI000B51105B|nr:hypothetical protein [Paenibacillus aquistagni]